MTANNLSKHFLLYWQKQNPDGRIYRNNSGATKTASGGFIRFGIPFKGGPDFIAFLPKQVFYSVKDQQWSESKYILTAEFYEIKTKNDRMSKEQKQFADLITGMGGNYYVVNEIKEKPYFKIEKWNLND